MTYVTRDARTLYVHPLLALAAAAGLAVMASTEDPKKEDVLDTRYGPVTTLGNGTARTYVSVDSRGVPVAVGVALSEGVMQGLQTGHDHHENVLSFPDEAGDTPFQHVTLGWNPAGHEPAGIYDLPHFDMHFYTVSDEDRRRMSPEDPQFQEKGERLPGPDYVPNGYVAMPDVLVPMMGNHLLDPTSPELNGNTFTETLIYGSYDGELIFIEPMITKVWLETRPEHTEALKLPARYPSAGLWPTEWTARFDEATREYRIELGGLTKRDS